MNPDLIFKLLPVTKYLVVNNKCIKKKEALNSVKNDGQEIAVLVIKAIGRASKSTIGINIKKPILDGNFLSIALIYLFFSKIIFHSALFELQFIVGKFNFNSSCRKNKYIIIFKR